MNPSNTSRLALLSQKEKIGFAMGDFGFNLYWASIASFLAVFYTDVFGLSAAAAATMFLVTKIIDAITDPLMGAIADRTRSRWGKFRPYLLWGCLPLAGAGVLTFSTPMLDSPQKLIYAYVTFSFLMLCYTVLSTPYSSLSGVMTAEPQERNTLISYRFIAAFAGTTLVNKYTLSLVNYFGDGDALLGWQLTMGLYGLVACVCFVTVFLCTRERVTPIAAQVSSPVNDIRDLLNNRPWLILVGLALVIMMTITLRGGSSFYYLKYYLLREDLISDYLFLQGLALGVGAATTPILTRFFDKKRLLLLLMSIVGLLSISLFFVPPENIELIFILNILISLALGPKSPLAWSMYADAADYTEWKIGRRATAMTFSAATFAQKMGGAMGSALMLWILSIFGYVANSVQTQASQEAIAMLQTIVPGIVAFIAVAITYQYPINNHTMQTIQNDLSERVAAQGAPR